MSDLGWVNLLFKNPFDLAVSGSGEIAADFRVRDGWFSKGTTLRVQPQGLKVQVLDYAAQGKGIVTFCFCFGKFISQSLSKSNIKKTKPPNY